MFETRLVVHFSMDEFACIAWTYTNPNRLRLEYLRYACFFTSTPLSTGITVPLNFAIVKPYRSRIRGSQCSEKRSCSNMGRRSSTHPPKMVSMVEELRQSAISLQICSADTFRLLRTPKHIVEERLRILWIRPSGIHSPLRKSSGQIRLCESR